MRTCDVVNWQIIGHPFADITQIDPGMNWDRMNRYIRGIWAGGICDHADEYPQLNRSSHEILSRENYWDISPKPLIAERLLQPKPIA